mmetsp:Transcript_11441/g.21628  ORF Transcript_11441/g.21628 Transcript_11441/m.21628 type:complete len:251 (+) Transcript_11441:41-793(+)
MHMILEPVTRARRQGSQPLTGRLSQGGVSAPSSQNLSSQPPSFQYPSFQYLPPPGALQPGPAGPYGPLPSPPAPAVPPLCGASPVNPFLAMGPPSVPHLPPPSLALPLMPPGPAGPGPRNDFEFLKSPQNVRDRGETNDDLRDVEKHVQELLQGQERLRQELKDLRLQTAAQTHELETMRGSVGRPKLPPTRPPDTPTSFPEDVGARRVPRAGSRPPEPRRMEVSKTSPSRSQNWDDSVADCLLCARSEP